MPNSDRIPNTNSAVLPLEPWFTTPQTPNISVKRMERMMKTRWNALSDMFNLFFFCSPAWAWVPPLQRVRVDSAF